jgi:hypothetical protein
MLESESNSVGLGNLCMIKCYGLGSAPDYL